MESKDLTVVVVNDFDYVQGGASKVAIDTAQLLHDNGINVIFFSATHKDNEYDFKQVCTNQNECLRDGIRGAFRGLYNIRAANELNKLLKTLDRDNTIVHINGWTKSLSSSIFRTLRKQNFKVVLTLHDYFTACPNGGLFNYQRCETCKKRAMSIDCIKTNCDSRNYAFKIYRVVRQFIQNINTRKCKNINLISISDFSVDKLINYFSEDVKIEKIPNPILTYNEVRVHAEKNDTYVYVGRVSKEKGVDVFCEAVSKLKVKAIVVGDGSELEFLKKKYKDIDFVGWKNQSEIFEYMKQARCLVFPSLWYETAGLTAIEASSLGVPVIVSDNTAATDYITNNYDGLYFKTGNVNDLVKKIKITSDDKFVKKLSENAYSRNSDNPYSFEKYFDKLYKLYSNILEDK